MCLLPPHPPPIVVTVNVRGYTEMVAWPPDSKKSVMKICTSVSEWQLEQMHDVLICQYMIQLSQVFTLWSCYAAHKSLQLVGDKIVGDKQADGLM